MFDVMDILKSHEKNARFLIMAALEAFSLAALCQQRTRNYQIRY